MNGTDRRTFLLALPPAVGSLGLPRGTTEEQEFKRLVLQGVREILDNDGWTLVTIATAVCHCAASVKEELIPLTSLWVGKCADCDEKMEHPHPRQLFRCQECGDQKDSFEALLARIPEDHPRRIPMRNVIYGWKEGESPDKWREDLQVEMKELGIWPWGNGGAA